jgi:uncharacterized caspase-like protein
MLLAFSFWGHRLNGAVAVAAMAVLFGLAGPANAQSKVALVIGNGTYRNVPELPNPPNDAADVASALLRLGFSVRLVNNASYEVMRRALLEFTPKARDAEMAVVFFAGHGMEVGGENWLIPVDAELKTDLDIEQEAISLRSVMLMVSAASKLGLVVLDACRNNPFLAKIRRSIATRAVARGLSPVEPMNNVLVAYAAKDGTTAADGDGRNSPFTTALLKYLEAPGLEINFLFRNVRDDVIAATGSEQQPFIYGSLSKEAIYLTSPPAARAPAGSDEAAWSVLKDTTDAAALKRYTAQFPESPLRKNAEARIAALEAAAAAKGAPANQIEPHELARSLQFELKRVGCFDGSVNGEFDEATRAAWHKFAKTARIELPDQLSADALKAVRGIDKRVCPLLCPDGEHAQGERCIANAPPRNVPPAKKNAEREPPRKQATKNYQSPHPAPDTGATPHGFSGGGSGGAGCSTVGGARIGGTFCP